MIAAEPKPVLELDKFSLRNKVFLDFVSIILHNNTANLPNIVRFKR